jgi:hypothetical protein
MNYDELKAAINIQNLLYWVTHHGEKLDDTTNMATGNHSTERGVYRGNADGVLGGRGDQAIKTHAPSHD